MATTGTVSAAELAEQISGNRTGDIRRTLVRLIESGELAEGTRLPTIRDVASALDTSVGSVADAWAEVRKLGLVDTRRRGGTVVIGPSLGTERPSAEPTRATHLFELARSSGDPSFLPQLAPALTVALARGEAAGSDFVVPSLRDAASRLLPFTPPAIAVAPGTHAAVRLTLAALIGHGDIVAAEDPTCLRTPGLLRGLGAAITTFESDAEGPIPTSVAAALSNGAVAIVFQPQAAVPLGSTLSRRRRDELAAVLSTAAAKPWIIEDDPSGPLGAVTSADGARPESLGAVFPDRTIRIVNLARAFGGELQTTIIAGASEAIRAVVDLQRRDGTRPNPILQAAAAALIADPKTEALVERAAEAYARRSSALLSALAARGIDALGLGGFFAWVPVLDERDALLALAERGISASPGSRSCIDPALPHIRVATTRLPDDPLRIAELADAIAGAATHTLGTEDE